MRLVIVVNTCLCALRGPPVCLPVVRIAARAGRLVAGRVTGRARWPELARTARRPPPPATVARSLDGGGASRGRAVGKKPS